MYLLFYFLIFFNSIFLSNKDNINQNLDFLKINNKSLKNLLYQLLKNKGFNKNNINKIIRNKYTTIIPFIDFSLSVFKKNNLQENYSAIISLDDNLKFNSFLIPNEHKIKFKDTFELNIDELALLINELKEKNKQQFYENEIENPGFIFFIDKENESLRYTHLCHYPAIYPLILKKIKDNKNEQINKIKIIIIESIIFSMLIYNFYYFNL